MTSDERDFDRLLHLTAMRPDDAHREAVRARCHAALARQRRVREDHRGATFPPVWRAEFAAFGGIAVIYVLVVIREALAMYGAR